MTFNPGDLVWIVPEASHLVRNENIATKAILVREIAGGWWRVHMSWLDKTKMVDLPATMLKRVVLDDTKSKE